jgi:hypothetical protein
MSQRAAAIQSIAVLLNHRQKQQEEDLEQNLQQKTTFTKKYIYYDNNQKNEKIPKSILKGKNDENDVGRRDVFLNNYSRGKNVLEHSKQFSGKIFKKIV